MTASSDDPPADPAAPDDDEPPPKPKPASSIRRRVPPGTAATNDDDDPKASPPGVGTPTASGSAAGTRWFCNATGWVRVCGFANVCSNQMVSGIGSGTDRYMASTMAKNACENMARARGSATVCMVACTPK